MRTLTRVPAAAPEGRPSSEEAPFHEPLRLRLRRRVLSLGYPGCVALVGRLLGEMGYEDVRPVGRTRLNGYNRRGGGGWDLEALLPAGVGSRRVVVRVKHVPRDHAGPDPKPVHNRCVDELRGAALRRAAAEGLIVTTGSFSLTARRAAGEESSAVAPARLVDGDELVELLLAHGVGVRETRPFLGRARLELDESFFAVLDGLGAGKDGTEKDKTDEDDTGGNGAGDKAGGEDAPVLRVCVRIGHLGKRVRVRREGRRR